MVQISIVSRRFKTVGMTNICSLLTFITNFKFVKIDSQINKAIENSKRNSVAR